MKAWLTKKLVMTLVNLRWFYFHINPNYIKFYIDSEKKEAHFQNVKTGMLHSNYTWKDKS